MTVTPLDLVTQVRSQYVNKSARDLRPGDVIVETRGKRRMEYRVSHVPGDAIVRPRPVKGYGWTTAVRIEPRRERVHVRVIDPDGKPLMWVYDAIARVVVKRGV